MPRVLVRNGMADAGVPVTKECPVAFLTWPACLCDPRGSPRLHQSRARTPKRGKKPLSKTGCWCSSPKGFSLMGKYSLLSALTPCSAGSAWVSARGCRCSDVLLQTIALPPNPLAIHATLAPIVVLAEISCFFHTKRKCTCLQGFRARRGQKGLESKHDSHQNEVKQLTLWWLCGLCCDFFCDSKVKRLTSPEVVYSH